MLTGDAFIVDLCADTMCGISLGAVQWYRQRSSYTPTTPFRFTWIVLVKAGGE